MNTICSEPLSQVAITKGFRLCPSCWAAAAMGMKFGGALAFVIAAIVAVIVRLWR